MRKKRVHAFTDEELLQMIRDRAAELGHAPIKKEMPLSGVIKQRFGTWKQCIIKAGLTPYHQNAGRNQVTSDRESLGKGDTTEKKS